MTALVVLCYVVAAIAFIDAVRRPSYEWIVADRNRAFWLVMLVFFNAFSVLIYALFVLPRFPRGQQVDAAFLKSAGPDAITKRGGNQ